MMLATWGVLLLTVVAASHITRKHLGDTFQLTGPCTKDSCVGESSGTADLGEEGGFCSCRCLPNLPVFRDDLHICVDDIHECPLVPFVSGTTYQKMPYVFLPLKGQIIYPSAEITFTGVMSPICVVSGAKFLTRGGWAELRNRTDSEPPFRLYRDEGKTFLQWLGDSDLRLSMEGRLILVHLMCKDMGDGENQQNNIITPCVSFKVAGTPSDPSFWGGVREVSFSADPQSNSEGMGSGYVAIAVCSVLLGLVYVASVMLYLQARKRQAKHRESSQAHISVAEEGVVKSNPLLRHCHDNMAYLTDTAPSSESDDCSDAAPLSDDSSCINAHSVQITSAMVHPCTIIEERERQSMEPMQLQESNTIERLPEENVSIVETLDNREDRPETVRAMACGNTRRKLYFNPAYFEPELLLAPPPAAIEFLTKIREVISIAKTKIEAKRFLPSLMGIPEETEKLRQTSSVAGSESVISLKRENSRRHGCTAFSEVSDSRMKVDILSGCHGCCGAISENKQKSIRQWLENVPILKTKEEMAQIKALQKKCLSSKGKAPKVPSNLTDKNKEDQYFKNIMPEGVNAIKELCSAWIGSKISGENMFRTNHAQSSSDVTLKISKCNNEIEPNLDKCSKSHRRDCIVSDNSSRYIHYPPPPPPSVCSNASTENRTQNNFEINGSLCSPKFAKKLIDAVRKENRETETEKKPSPPVRSDSLSNINVSPSNQNAFNDKAQLLEAYDVDSLERTQIEKKCGFSTPSDYGDPESQPIPKLNALAEEITINNSLFHSQSNFSCIAKLLNNDIKDDHEYEVIMMRPDGGKGKSLPEILSRSEGYSLVSEVYVNDGYCCSSESSLPSNASSMNSLASEPGISYAKENPGHLTIQVEDSPINYQLDDSDSFEPDTLDRKPSKLKINSETYSQFLTNRDYYSDSLERPQISLRTTGSFRSDSMDWCESNNLFNNQTFSPLNRTFGSLREIFEAKNKYNQCTHNRIVTISPVSSTQSLITEKERDHKSSWKRGKPKLLRPEAKQARRQRQPSPPNDPITKPPHSPGNTNLEALLSEETREQCPPLPPRIIRPPLPPKNGPIRSTCREKELKAANRPLPLLPTESGLPCTSRNSPVDASGNSPQSSDYEPMASPPESMHLGHQFQMNLKIISGGKPGRDAKYMREKKVGKQRRPISRIHQRTEDSGYLSTDSNGSDVGNRREESISETDDSFFDGASESGAESIATDSFFFGQFNKMAVTKDTVIDPTDIDNISHDAVVQY